jgi:hypothetical protein
MRELLKRRAIRFLLALALFLGGAYTLWLILTYRGLARGWGLLILVPLVMPLGGYWLWVEFIAPAIGRRKNR